jgi:hypothetical protein
VKSRIILTPEHVKRLAAALQDNITKYESVHGIIKDDKRLCSRHTARHLEDLQPRPDMPSVKKAAGEYFAGGFFFVCSNFVLTLFVVQEITSD